VDPRIKQKLRETSDSLSLYSARPPSQIEEVFNFNVREMDTIASATLSKYTVMLGQYLITLQIRFNTARVIGGQKKKVLERKIQELIQSGVTEGKTLKEREANAIALDPELQALELDYDEAAAERDLLDGIDKPIIELMNALKSENRRREAEKQYTIRERAS
jgi:hypothetical protein